MFGKPLTLSGGHKIRASTQPTGPQSFLEHLQEEHDYDQSEAHSILNS